MPNGRVSPGGARSSVGSVSQDAEPLTDELRRRALILQILEDARSQGRRRRLAVSGPPALAALACAALGIVLFAYADGGAPELLASAFLLVLGPVLLLFAILPADVRLTTLATCFLCFVNVATVLATITDDIIPAVWHFGKPACAARYVVAAEFGCSTIMSVALCAVTAEAVRALLSGPWLPQSCVRARVSPAELLHWLWELNGARLLVLAASRIATYAVAPTSRLRHSDDILCFVAYMLLALGLATVCLHPPLRASARRWLMVRGEAVSAAAGISMLFDSRFKRVDTAIASAVASLRGVRADRVTLAALSGQMSQGAAFLLSQPAHVCGIDAFICHSSRDPPALKWTALQSWRARFVEANGRQPVVWLDRCCLDHSLRGVGLANLPVTIASCQSMVVLFGSTSLSRLWCVVELFVHQHMGGRKLELVYLPGSPPPAVDTFDAWHSECHLPEDRLWLLSCIETATGTREDFNSQMRALLARADHLDKPVSRYDHELHSVAIVPSIHSAFNSGASSSKASMHRPTTPAPTLNIGALLGITSLRRGDALGGRSGSAHGRGQADALAPRPPLAGGYLPPLAASASYGGIGGSASNGEMAVAIGGGGPSAPVPPALGSLQSFAERSLARARLRCAAWPVLLAFAAVSSVVAVASVGTVRSRAQCVRCAAVYGLHPDGDGRGGAWVRFASKKYMLLDKLALSFDEAHADCVGRGAGLVSIETAEEDEFVLCMCGGSDFVWLGLSRPGEQDAWAWESGGQLQAGSYTNWVPHSSDGATWATDARECAYANGAGWSAADRPCRARLAYVCEAALGDEG
mmetsp:Transcript_4984/g.12890  ORF Transcript_4984/g.12890 Transcript_4984/m.12890 type:complete len:811 (+) Transcript_4984:152-2584(+)